jgi:hypothetical protein
MESKKYTISIELSDQELAEIAGGMADAQNLAAYSPVRPDEIASHAIEHINEQLPNLYGEPKGYYKKEEYHKTEEYGSGSPS